MKLSRSAGVVGLLILSAGAVGAQDPPAGEPVTPNTQLFSRIAGVVTRIQSVFGAPLHPLIGTIAPGGSWGAGLGYDAPGRGPWDLSAKTLYTLNRYWLAEVVAGYKGRRAELEGFGRMRDMTRLDFFGPGAASNLFDRTNFRLKDPVVGAHGMFRVASWLALGGRVEELWPDVSPGRSPSLRSIEERFAEASAPGLTEQPRFGRYQASADLHLPAAAGDGFYQGMRSRVSYAFYDDQEAELFNFRRLDIEAQQKFAGFGAHHRLTLSGWASTSMTDDGQEVPFYLQHTLGGKSAIRSVREVRLGTDGTDATLRGYRDLRFRDRHLLLLQAEYRVPVWGLLDATVFADAGKVTSTRGDLDLADLRRDFGFSLSVMKGWATAARVDVGFGSGEGTRVFLSLGELTP
jgi:hypothetical protein